MNNNNNNDIKLNKYYPILLEFHNSMGKYNSEESRLFIDKYIDNSIQSETIFLNGYNLKRRSKEEVLNVWIKAFNEKWKHELINENEWSVSTNGDIDTLIMKYKLMINQNVTYFKLETKFNNKSNLWIKSVYTQIEPPQTTASKIGSFFSSIFSWYASHTSSQLNSNLNTYSNIMGNNSNSNVHSHSSSSSTSNSDEQFRRNRNRDIQNQNNTAIQNRQKQEQLERERKQSLVR